MRENLRKKLRCAAVLLLCAALLIGCAVPAFHTDGRRSVPRFSEMEYSRPDMSAIEKNINAALDALENEVTYRALVRLLERCYDDLNAFATMTELASIRADMNMRDAYYAAESAWCNEQFYSVRQMMEELYCACAKSKYGKRLEENFFWEGFLEEYGDEASVTDDACVALLQRESALVARYYALMLDPTIRMDGDEVKLNDYLSYVGSYDYTRALTLFCEQYNERFADIYAELVKLRKELAQRLGYDTYEQMQFEYFFGRDYTPEQAERYVREIREYIVPLYHEIMSDNPYARADYYYVDSDETLEVLCSAVGQMGGAVGEACDFMLTHELFDIERRDDKADRSYQTYITDYEAPFLFTKPLGDVSDILTAAHEFGHYTDAYVNYNRDESIDLAEVFSQSMEYLVLDRADKVLSAEQTENLLLIKLLDTLELYVQQASFYEFEKAVFEADEDELDAEFLSSLSLRLAEEYGYCTGMNKNYYAYSWLTVVHFFEQPFYVISYPVSNSVAMQVYELELEESGSGLDKFLALLTLDTGYIIEAAERAGLESPFDEGAVSRTADTLMRFAESCGVM